MSPIQRFGDWMFEHQFKDERAAEFVIKEAGKRIFLRGLWAATFLANVIRQVGRLMTDGYDLVIVIGLTGSAILGVGLIFVGMREASRMEAAVAFIRLAASQQNFNHGRKFGEGRSE